MSRIAPVGIAGPSASDLATLEKAAEVSAQKKGDADPRIHKAAQEFEGVLLRQLLEASKIGGGQKAGQYGSMAVDALADGITKAGGLGLVSVIERCVGDAQRTAEQAEHRETGRTPVKR
jgi:Rod binding domain-containing protein